MITRIIGHLNRILDDRIRVQVGPIEYELLVSEATKANLSAKINQEITLHTRHYLEAGAMQSTIHPRIIGFENEQELEFFDLICTVDKIGVRKALRALCRPVPEIASAIQRGDVKALSKLPGFGAATAEKVVSTLQKKMLPYSDQQLETGRTPVVDPILNELISTLTRLGLSHYEARSRVDALVASGQKFTTIEEAMMVAYRLS